MTKTKMKQSKKNNGKNETIENMMIEIKAPHKYKAKSDILPKKKIEFLSLLLKLVLCLCFFVLFFMFVYAFQALIFNLFSFF
jgi:hypothetical protein